MVPLSPLTAGLGDAVPRDPWAVTIKAWKSHGQAGFKRPCGALMTTGILQDSAAGRQQFERQMEARRLAEAHEEEFKPLRRGWCLGGEEFRQAMLALMDGKLGENHSGQLQRETAEQRASRIIAEPYPRSWEWGAHASGVSLAASRRKHLPSQLNHQTVRDKWGAAANGGTPLAARGTHALPTASLRPSTSSFGFGVAGPRQ